MHMCYAVSYEKVQYSVGGTDGVRIEILAN